MPVSSSVPKPLSKIVIDELFEKVEDGKDFSVPNTWTQGRTVYGGLSAALLLRALERQVSPEKLLRSLNVAFSAPTKPDIDFVMPQYIIQQNKHTIPYKSTCV